MQAPGSMAGCPPVAALCSSSQRGSRRLRCLLQTRSSCAQPGRTRPARRSSIMPTGEAPGRQQALPPGSLKRPRCRLPVSAIDSPPLSAPPLSPPAGPTAAPSRLRSSRRWAWALKTRSWRPPSSRCSSRSRSRRCARHRSAASRARCPPRALGCPPDPARRGSFPQLFSASLPPSLPLPLSMQVFNRLYERDGQVVGTPAAALSTAAVSIPANDSTYLGCMLGGDAIMDGEVGAPAAAAAAAAVPAPAPARRMRLGRAPRRRRCC